MNSSDQDWLNSTPEHLEKCLIYANTDWMNGNDLTSYRLFPPRLSLRMSKITRQVERIPLVYINTYIYIWPQIKKYNIASTPMPSASLPDHTLYPLEITTLLILMVLTSLHLLS